MLSNTHYYHRIVRKMVIGFGTIFNNLKMYRYASDGVTEIERINVPLTYTAKEKFYTRITEDPTLSKTVQITLPRMGFEMTGITYDPLRKISSNIDLYKNSVPNSVNRAKGTPYNFDFNLYAFVRNTEDGMQIVEQILPYFNPDYTITIDLMGFDNLKLDIPIVFNSVTYENQYEGDSDTTRVITWNMNFTAKGYLFGPVTTSKVIRKATANVYSYVGENDNKGLSLVNGNGQEYRLGELVYQGASIEEATAKAYVKQWNTTANTLILYDVTGNLATNSILVGAVSGAKYNVSTFATSAAKLINIEIDPNPSTANANTDFGFTSTVTELF